MAKLYQLAKQRHPERWGKRAAWGLEDMNFLLAFLSNFLLR